MQGKGFKGVAAALCPLGLLLGAAWLALASLSGCVAGRSDALEKRDENLFHDLTREARDGESTEPASRDMGERLREWSEKFERSDTLSLAECFRLALIRSEELLLQGEKLFESWTYKQESISSLLPEVRANWTYSRDSDAIRFSGQTITPRDSTQSWLTLRQKIFDGRSLAAIPAAREAMRIERLRLVDTRDRLLYAVASGFFGILGLEHDVKVFEASLESNDEFYRVVDAQWKAGEASRQELMTARAQRDEAEATLIQGWRDLKVARRDLARLVGLNDLPEKLNDTYEVALSPGRLPDLVEAASRDRSDLEAARAGIEFAKAERLAALSDYLPEVNAEFTRWLKREGAFSSDIDWNLSLNLVWTLFDSGAREARQARALSTIRQREYELSALERQVRYEVEEAVLSFEALGQVMGALRSRFEASQAALDLANAEYRAAEATNLDVILARNSWERASRDLYRAQLARKLSALKIRLVVGNFHVTEPLEEAVEIAEE